MRDNLAVAGKWTLIAVASVIGVWMRIPSLVQTLIAIMGMDVLSVIFAAVVTKQLNSTLMFRGIFGKLAVFPLLAALHYVEKPLNLSFEFESIAAAAFIAYEVMSIVENCARAGVPIPIVIVKVLAAAKVRTATPDDIAQEFQDHSKLTVVKAAGVIQTPASMPDLLVEKTTSTLEETHVSEMPSKNG